MTVKVSVLIGSRNRPDSIIKCINSIIMQDYEPMEILILDDNSDLCDLREIISKNFNDKRLSCFRADTSLGVAGGRNLLMQKASGDIFIVVDDDAYFTDNNCITKIVEIFANNSQIGVIATKVINFDGQKKLQVPFSKNSLKKQPELVNNTQLVSYYIGCCHAIHSRVIETCGFYQQNLVYGGEELDLSYRVIEAGFQILYTPNVVIHHCPEKSVVAQNRNGNSVELFFYTRNRIFLAYKYLPTVYIPIHLAIWMTRYAFTSFKNLSLREFINGILAGIRGLSEVQRQPLSDKAIKYLKSSNGRLWY